MEPVRSLGAQTNDVREARARRLKKVQSEVLAETVVDEPEAPVTMEKVVDEADNRPIMETPVIEPKIHATMKSAIDERKLATTSATTPDTPQITLTKEQQSVVDEFVGWYRANKGYGVYQLAGYAGVGKSTVVDFILKRLQTRVKLCASTGTAALVLREKTPNYETSTMHKLFYKAEQKPNGQVYFIPSPVHLHGTKLVIIDEASMIGQHTAEEILPIARRAKCKVLIVGDPGQLPPVKQREYFLLEPNAMLTKIMRQAAGNPIIDLSMKIRQASEHGHAYRFDDSEYKRNNALFVMNRERMTIPYLSKVIEHGGAVIVGANRTRTSLNKQIREHLGFTKRDVLMDGEKICIKKNYPESEEGVEVTNGMVGSVSNVKQVDDTLYSFIFTPDAFEGARRMTIRMDILFEKKGVSMYKLLMENKERKVMGRQALDLGVEAVLGYAITCHASQGNQWDTVVTVNEAHLFGRDNNGNYHDKSYLDQNRWLYTAVTRAAKNLVVFN